MNPRSRTIGVVACLLVSSCVHGPAIAQLPADLKSDLGPNVPAFKVRPGYRVTRAVVEKKLRNVRFVQFSQDGKTLFVSNREDGVIYALSDPDADGVYHKVTNFVTKKRSVQGMDFHDGWLY